MIRLAIREDLKGVLALYKELRPHDVELEAHFAKAKWGELLDDPSMLLVVAERDGELASTCALGLNRSIANGARPFGIIEHVVTSQNFRKQGLSRKVLEYALKLAWQHDCAKVMVLSGEALTSAHRVYESVGFKGGIEKGFVIKPA
ncbi:GNAT family N-acetyltransferase [Pseudoalteromonas sp. MSK9-3]|uniref:GNAT family N-acetyltransferase n=1 Tax=Pseudoalteromonas sp. MSK9-3 TaxID=1897633 RepID=UPI000E6BA515|nr:GNAT family N-acetyltransferase [Pseudoalteromonas sp. MSK9-3]